MAKSERIVFKPQWSTYLLYITLVGLTILAISFFFEKKGIGITTIVTLLITIFYYLYNHLFKERISEIEIDKKNRFLRIKKTFNITKKKVDQYTLSNVSASFMFRTGARGAKVILLSIFWNEEVIAEISPDLSGFTKDQLEELSRLI